MLIDFCSAMVSDSVADSVAGLQARTKHVPPASVESGLDVCVPRGCTLPAFFLLQGPGPPANAGVAPTRTTLGEVLRAAATSQFNTRALVRR
jgi:hypothetical protein